VSDVDLQPAAQAVSSALQDAAGRAADYARAAHAANTRRAYQADWRDFARWCEEAEVTALPAEPATIGTYLADRAATRTVATLARRLAAISTAHRLAGHHLDTRHPAIRTVMQGIRRTHGTAPRRANPIRTSMLRALLDTCGTKKLIDRRDRALLLLGLASALRRSELAALTVANVDFVAEGVKLDVARSKTDQEGAGQFVGVVATGSETCPVAALRAWLEIAGITEGAVFRAINRHGRIANRLSDRAIALIVKRRAAAASLDPTAHSAHSLRAGCATEAAARGVEERDIGRHTRHHSIPVLRGYIRAGSLFVSNASARLGL
jgi:site-specific recombinase XerD